MALLRNLTAALFLTEREVPLAALGFSNARKKGVVERGVTPDDNEPKVKGRIVTTLEKAKEVRPMVENVHHDGQAWAASRRGCPAVRARPPRAIAMPGRNGARETIGRNGIRRSLRW